MDGKNTSDVALAENVRKVEELQQNVETLTSEKEELREELESETTRLGNEVAAMQQTLEASQSTVAEMEETLAVKDSTLNLMQERVNNSFDVYRKGGFKLARGTNGLAVSLPAPVQFRSGSTRIDGDSKMALADLAEKLMQNPTVKILVEGHTDSVPMKEGARFRNNQELSVARANRVVKELVSLGVNPLQLTATGYGASRPIVQDESDSEEARATNRRTEFVVMADVGALYEMAEGE